MEINEQVLRNDERLVFRLRELYSRFGYARFTMSKFEEYDLYVRNKDFLISDGVITFTDTNGRLLALKPDVTLSIIKNCRDGGGVQKLYYNENVYRVSPRTHDFQEIMQAGLECVGDVDLCCVSEVILLALESLRCAAPDYVLDLAHMGIADALADEAGLPPERRREAYALMGQKNLHELHDCCVRWGSSPEPLCALAAIGRGTLAQELQRLGALCKSGAARQAFAEFSGVVRALQGLGHDRALRLDFSIVSDMRYYSGVIFKGYLRGVPDTVLSGGRYDKLMRRMGKQAGGVGFAVYLDALERLGSCRPDEADLLLLYTEQDDPFAVFRKAAALAGSGLRVAACKEILPGMRYKKLVRFDGEETVC